MPFSLIPRGVYPAVTQISPKALAEKGVRLVLADLDNTLVPYKETEPTRAVRTWKDALAAEGITLFLLSNSRKPGRPHGFAHASATRASPSGRAFSGPWSAWASPRTRR